MWSLRPSKGVWEVKITSYNTTVLCSFLLSFFHKCTAAFPETCDITCDLWWHSRLTTEVSVRIQLFILRFILKRGAKNLKTVTRLSLYILLYKTYYSLFFIKKMLFMLLEAWRAAVHGAAKSRTWLSEWTELRTVKMQYNREKNNFLYYWHLLMKQFNFKQLPWCYGIFTDSLIHIILSNKNLTLLV